MVGRQAGRIAAQLRESLTNAGDGQPTHARIALSDTRVVVSQNFQTLVCHIVPLSGWWQDLFKDQTFNKAFENIEIRPDNLKGPRGKDAEFSRYVALVGFIDGLLRADLQARIEQLAKLAYRNRGRDARCGQGA